MLQSMMGMYGPSFDVCYIVGGMITQIPSIEILQKKQLGLMSESTTVSQFRLTMKPLS